MKQDLLTEQQLEEVVNKIAENVNLPELIEKAAIRLILKLFLGKVQKVLPNTFHDTISQSIEGGNIAPLIDRTTVFLNEKINIPLISEKTEGKLIKEILTAIIEAIVEAVKKSKLIK